MLQRPSELVKNVGVSKSLKPGELLGVSSGSKLFAFGITIADLRIRVKTGFLACATPVEKIVYR